MDECAVFPGDHDVIDPVFVHLGIEVQEDLFLGSQGKLYPVFQAQFIGFVDEQVSPLGASFLLGLIQAHEFKQVPVQLVGVLGFIVASLIVQVCHPEDLEEVSHGGCFQGRHAPADY